MPKKNKYVPVTSGTLHSFAYEVYVLATANELMKKFGITKQEAIKRVEEGLPKDQCVVTVREDLVGDISGVAV